MPSAPRWRSGVSPARKAAQRSATLPPPPPVTSTVTTAPLTAPPSAAQPPLLRFTGCAQFRQRLVFATLARRGLVITGIRSDDEVPGLKSYEATFLRLLDALTNGARIEINETGTALKYVPGIIVGGVLEHDCGVEKAIGWFIEGLLPLLPFGKKGVALTLTGVTNDDTDFNVDTLRTGVLPVLAHFGLTDGLALNIKRRGALPEGGGCVQLYCPSVRQLIPINLTEEGLVRKVRGISYCSRVSPQMANRLVEGSKGVLLKLLPDVHVYTDTYRGAEAGASPGYGVTLTAHTTSGCCYTVQRATSTGTPELPEDMGADAAAALLQEIRRGGCIDTNTQSLILTLMALCPEDVSRVRLGALSPSAIATLQLLRQMFGVVFKLTAETPDSSAAASAASAAAAAAAAAAVKPAKKRMRKSERTAAAAAAAAAGAAGEGEGGDEVTTEKAAVDSVKAVVINPLTGLPLSSSVATSRSDCTILASCLGIGYVNTAKKVT